MTIITETKDTFYTCKWDRPFKEILLKKENQDILKKILETVLHIKINSIIEENIERNQGNIKIRRKYLDVLLSTEKGLIGIELHATFKEYLHARNMAFHCDNYAHYTLVGEEYTEDMQVIQINFTYELSAHSDLEVVEIYEMQTKKGRKYVNNFILFEFNMDKIKEFWYSKDKEKIEEYKYLIMMDLNLKELELLSKEDKLVNKYMSNLEELNEDPMFREYMTKEEDARKCYNSDIRIATEKGLKEGFSNGLEQGAKQTATQVAKNLLALGINTTEQIAEVTNLSIEEVKNLKEE